MRKFGFLQLLHFLHISKNVDKTLREYFSQEHLNRKKIVAFAKNEYFCARKTQWNRGRFSQEIRTCVYECSICELFKRMKVLIINMLKENDDAKRTICCWKIEAFAKKCRKYMLSSWKYGECKKSGERTHPQIISI